MKRSTSSHRGSLTPSPSDVTHSEFPWSETLCIPGGLRTDLSKASCLNTFIETFRPSSQTILSALDSYLAGRGSAENTRRAYSTDIYQALTIKLFHQYDLPRRFDTCANLLLALHGAQKLDVARAQGICGDHEAFNHTAELVKYWRRQQPEALKIRAIEAPAVVLPSPLISTSPERLVMSLRGTCVGHQQISPSIAKTDRAMIDCFLGVLHSHLTREFWDSMLSFTSVGNLFSHLRQIGNDENTRARKISSLRVLERFLYERELLSKPVVRFIQAPRVSPKAQVVISVQQVKKLKDHLDNKVSAARYSGSDLELLQSLRNRAMFAVVHYTAIRAQALCNLRVHDFNPRENTLLVREKGRREAVKPIGGWALPWLREYLDCRQRALKVLRVEQEHKDHLFFSRLGMPIQRRAVARVFAVAAKEAGISLRVGTKTNFGPHADRRSRAQELYEKGASLEELRDFLGHRNVRTTEIYLRGSTIDQRAMLERFDGT